MFFALVAVGISVIFAMPSPTHSVIRKSIPVIHTSKPMYLVSLGDSVAAGDGLPVTSSTTSAIQCAQSNQAYPYMVAQAEHLILKQFACSGATIMNGIMQSQVVNGVTVMPQISSAKPYLPQSDVLITVGANDVNWEKELYTCAVSNCATVENAALFQQSLNQLQANLASMLQSIQVSHPKKVIINTYYPLLANDDTCLVSRGISTSKIIWVNNREAELNATISAAAKQFNDQPVSIVFDGHLLCSADPWIQNLSSSAPLHPTAAGQAFIASQDEQAL